MSSDKIATILIEKEDNQRIRYIANRHILQTFKTGDIENPYFLSNIVGNEQQESVLTITNGWVGIGVTNQFANNILQVNNENNNTLLAVNQTGVGINTSVPGNTNFSFSVYGSSYYAGDVGIGTTVATEKLRVEGNVQAYIFKARGADYAEWEAVSLNAGNPKSGTVVGFNKQGQITAKYSESIHFGVVSLNPSIIGNEEILDSVNTYLPVVYMGKIKMELNLMTNVQIGDYLIPCYDEADNITIITVSPNRILFQEYIKSIGYIHRHIEKSIYEIIIRM